MTAEQTNLMNLRRLRDKSYHLSMWSYAVITIFVGGFGWFWWSSGGFVHRPSSGPFILMGLSAAAYLLVRSFMFRNRQQQRLLRKKNR